MPGLSDVEKGLLIERLFGVDLGIGFASNQSSTPEVVKPTASPLEKDSGAPGTFLSNLQTADLQTQILTGTGVLVALIGLFALAKKFF